jgi:spore coat protein A, manganese oxidase
MRGRRVTKDVAPGVPCPSGESDIAGKAGSGDASLSRRGFLSVSAVAAGAGLGMPLWRPTGHVLAAGGVAEAFATTVAGLTASHPVFVQSPPTSRFLQPLRGVYPLDPGGIPVAVPDGTREYLDGRLVVDHYTIDIAQYRDRLHPALAPTTLWGFQSVKNLGGTPPQRHLGGIIVGERGKPIQITFRNKLPNAHILPVDTSLMGAAGARNRTCVHMHGGLVPWTSDGGPFTWFRPRNGLLDAGPFYGPSAAHGPLNIYRIINPDLHIGEAEVYYPLHQSARLLWYHDHAVGITRLNAYAGIATALILRDDFERGLVTRGMPDFIEKGGREIPLVIQEKIFLPADDPKYPGSAKTFSSLWYPYRYDSARWDHDPNKNPQHLPISVIPEMFGDRMLVNGVVHPHAPVEPRRYRLRILNATQARFLNLQLYVESAPNSKLPDFGKPGPDFLVIGTEGGFLARPALVPSGKRLNVTVDESGDRSVDPADAGGSLLTGPAERWDVIVDFKGYKGRNLILYNDAPAPFPAGDNVNDGPRKAGTMLNQTIMRFEVGTTVTAPADAPLTIRVATPLAADPNSRIDPALVGSWAKASTKPRAVPDGVKVRKLTLNEIFDAQGRLIQMLGTNDLRNLPRGFTLPVDPDTGEPPPGAPRTAAMRYDDPATETPHRDDIEAWEIANLTGDVHPMHFHLVNVQVLSRRPFEDYKFDAKGDGKPVGLGTARGPDATELGWKDTVRMNPNEVTTVIMKFAFSPVPFHVPHSPRTGGNEYVWHCHILEHEEHDMMRPLIVSGEYPRL